MSRKHPYVGLPDRQFWKKEPGIKSPALFDPVSSVSFKITPEDRIVTAGSCFAQHVSHNITKSGFNHFISEPLHPLIDPKLAEVFNYGMFSARYGNVYTARQLLQLLQRAYGHFAPIDSTWPLGDAGRVVDPFRPQIQPNGFGSSEELVADQRYHLACVRRSMENLNIFVFTLGLTEAWMDRRDGAVYPIAPGISGGRFDPEVHSFTNFSETESSADLVAALRMIRAVNPGALFILTVSPVPLNATMVNRHVFVSTTWSKAVLRIAAENAVSTLDRCCYFPSYEVITSPYSRGRYFGSDCREVTPEGVAHVMQLFFRHFADCELDGAPVQQHANVLDLAQDVGRKLEEKINILCDEEAINNEA